jgi:hypothetical protein
MGIQVKAFALLFAALFLVDAIAWHGEYRDRLVTKVSSLFGSVHGLGPGRNWSTPKPSRNN